MPCDVGYKSYAKTKIPAPEPQTFLTASEAPDISADLLDKLGIEDPDFLSWVSSIDTRSLLEEALKRALKATKTGGLSFSLDERGMLKAEGRFTTDAEKRRLEEVSSMMSKRWQFEILGIVAELLDYTSTITQNAGLITLEAEESGKSHPCDYIKISQRGDEAEITFEHFKSRRALDLATAKFTALANKLGVKISIEGCEIHQGSTSLGETHHAGEPHLHGSHEH